MDKEFLKNIDKIKIGTKSGKITWTKKGERVFIWKTADSKERPINMILQEIEKSDSSQDVVFRLWDVESMSPLFEIRTDSSDEESKTIIKDLYNYVKSNYLIDNSNILSEILKDI